MLQLLFNAWPGIGDNAERVKHFSDPGIRDVVSHVAGTISGNLIPFLFRQAQVQSFGNNGVIIEEIPDLRFNVPNQMSLFQKAQPCIPGLLNICCCSLSQLFAGQFQELIGKHPVS